jgi:hypothetical protein
MGRLFRSASNDAPRPSHFWATWGLWRGARRRISISLARQAPRLSCSASTLTSAPGRSDSRGLARRSFTGILSEYETAAPETLTRRSISFRLWTYIQPGLVSAPSIKNPRKLPGVPANAAVTTSKRKTRLPEIRFMLWIGCHPCVSRQHQWARLNGTVKGLCCPQSPFKRVGAALAAPK